MLPVLFPLLSGTCEDQTHLMELPLVRTERLQPVDTAAEERELFSVQPDLFE
eukprot:m.316100 g.316100  ORF g.316100 m.316100 type:complete len:52 (+) comp55458_c2_seq25:621-776(+)